MSHYNPAKDKVKLRCGGNDHSWGDTYLDYSSVDVVLDSDGNICLKIEWKTVKDCTNPHANNVKTVKQTCQATTRVDLDSIVVPIESLKKDYDL